MSPAGGGGVGVGEGVAEVVEGTADDDDEGEGVGDGVVEDEVSFPKLSRLARNRLVVSTESGSVTLVRSTHKETGKPSSQSSSESGESSDVEGLFFPGTPGKKPVVSHPLVKERGRVSTCDRRG